MTEGDAAAFRFVVQETAKRLGLDQAEADLAADAAMGFAQVARAVRSIRKRRRKAAAPAESPTRAEAPPPPPPPPPRQSPPPHQTRAEPPPPPPPRQSRPRSAKQREALRVLGLDESATPEQIRSAYRKKAHAHHPDRGGSHEKMAALNAAYEQLR